MFGFNRNNDGGPIGRLFKGTSFDYTNNRYNNNYDNNGSFSGYDNGKMREESFIRKYMVFRIKAKIWGFIIGLVFILMLLFSFSSRNKIKTNNTNTTFNNSSTTNVTYKNNNYF